MTFDTPFSFLVYGFTFGLTIAACIHYVVWPMKAGRWFKIFGGNKR
jgi:hypothetical protein